MRSLSIAYPRGWPGYAMAGALVALSVLVKAVLMQLLATDAGYIVYVPAIALSAWLGGLRAGLLATAVAALLNVWSFVGPTQTFVVSTLADQLRLAVFLLAGSIISGLSGRLRRALVDAQASAASRATVETELLRSRDQLEAVLGSVTDGITLQDWDGRLLYANEEAARLSGYSSGADLVAAPVAEVVSRFQMTDEAGDPLPPEELPYREAMRGVRGEERLIRFTPSDTGDERWSLNQAAPVLDAGGSVRFVVNSFRDVTDRRRREQADRFLADATTVLATTLDESATIDRLAELAIERLADWCVVDVLASDGPGVRTAIAHRDPARRELARRWRDVTPFDIDGDSGPARVIRTGVPELIPEITVEALEAAASGHALGQELMTLGLRSMICVPVVARGRRIGAVTMATAESERRFDQHDLSVATELGGRAGVALENSRLYRVADERRAELMATLSAIGEAVLVFDVDGRLLLHNPAAEGLLPGEPRRTLAEWRAALDIDGQATPRWPDAAKEPIAVRRPDGRWLEVAAYRTLEGPDGAVERAGAGSTILVVRDVTGPRAAQAAREAFMGLLSHELRTPITTIYGGTRLLERKLPEERRMEVVRDVRAEAERLYRLVEDLLVMTRVERGGVEIGDEPILLQRVLDSVVRTEESRWPGLQVQQSISDQLPAVRGDLTYVEQVMRNLLGNAAKYGGIGHPVELVAEDLGAEVGIRVLDRGPGIGADEAERVFDLFYRGATTAATASGAGIGLFVCRALVTAMDGRIWAGPRTGGGSEFGFSLPVLEIDEVL